MGKNYRELFVLLGFIIGLFTATIFILVGNFISKDIINWLSAIGTVGAVIVSLFLANRTEKAHINFKVSFLLYENKTTGERYKFKYVIDGINFGKGSDVVDQVELVFPEGSRNMAFTSHIPITPNNYFKETTEHSIFLIEDFSNINSKTLIKINLSTYSGRVYTTEIYPTIIVTEYNIK